jgi:hypothetical protein
MVAYLPPGWPTGVHPPGSEDFERTAVTWLLDVVPPDYRLHGVLRRHPVALATLARRHLTACVEGARQGYRTARTELGGVLPVSGLDAVLAAYRTEGRRLVTAADAANLVEQALRGKEFAPQLHDAPGSSDSPGPQDSSGPHDSPVPQDSSGSQHPSGPRDSASPQRPSRPHESPVPQDLPGPPSPPGRAGRREQPTPRSQPHAPGKQQHTPGRQRQEQPAGRKQRQKQPTGGKQRQKQAVG